MSLKLIAPLSGPVIAIEKVPDPVFAQKMVGDGIAIDPVTQVLLAPCAGEVIQIHSAHHALTIAAENGIQVLLHIGLDTVHLKGQGFLPKVKLGSRVKAGQPLIEFDADAIARTGKSLITVMVVTGDTPIQILPLKDARAGKDVLIEVQPAQIKASAPTVRTTAESSAIRTTLPTGLHARPAALLANLAKTFTSDIELITEQSAANAKSVVAILALEIGDNECVQFFAEGPDAKAAVVALGEFLRNLREEAKAAPAPVAPRKTSTDPSIVAGIGVSPGLAIGSVRQIRTQTLTIQERPDGTPAQEKEHLHQALQLAVRELEQLHDKVKAKMDSVQAAIFSAHQELLEDPDILASVDQLLKQRKSAAFAWNSAITEHAQRLEKLNNELMAGRANDLRDVGRRVLRLLTAQPVSSLAAFGNDTILIAENLTPSEAAELDRDQVRAFCTVSGGATSHVAILARSLGLPAIAGADPRILLLPDGSEIIVDGDQGEIRLNPNAEQKQDILARQAAQAETRKTALGKAHDPAATLDGHRIEIAANIGSVADAKEAVAMGADGVGLLRSEFLFLERENAPSEDEQHLIYQQIADLMSGKTLVIRTLDVGGDKPLRYLPLPLEENPFLGIRGIRVGLLHQDILRTQLRAILRVRSQAKLHIMFPMIATLEEFRKAKAILEEERRKLDAPAVQVGIMVEVPSVAMLADEFAKEVDFFSIGTNDLTQYTLAMDRGHKDLAKQADALHPSVLKLIELTCKAARAHGRWVGVCGGLAGEQKAVPILIGLGVEELSVSLPTIPLIKAQVRETSLTDARALAAQALQASSAAEVRRLTSNVNKNPLQKGAAHATGEDVVFVPTENR